MVSAYIHTHTDTNILTHTHTHTVNAALLSSDTHQEAAEAPEELHEFVLTLQREDGGDEGGEARLHKRLGGENGEGRKG